MRMPTGCWNPSGRYVGALRADLGQEHCFNFRTQVLNNTALCCLKLDEFDLALEACRLVLTHVYPGDDKAAFRAALASKKVSDGKAAGISSSPELVAQGRTAAAAATPSGAAGTSMHTGVGSLLRALKDAVRAHMPAETEATAAASAAAAAAAPPSPAPARTPAAPAHVTPATALKISMLTSSAISAAVGGQGWQVHR